MFLPLSIAISTLKRNPGRTALTILGIVIGITAVVAVLSIGLAIKALIIGELESFGSNIIQVEVKTPQTKQNSSQNAFSMVGGSIISTLKESDALALLRQPNIAKYYAGVMGQEIVSYNNDFQKVMLLGTNQAFIDIDQSEVEFGRFFTQEDEAALARVAVIGSKVKEKLFGDQDAINQDIKIGQEHFAVIGQMKERGASFGFDYDNLIFLPLQTLQKRFLGIDYVTYMVIQLKDNSLANQTADDIEYTLRERHKITDPDKDDFAVSTMEKMMTLVGSVVSGIQILLIALGSISLIVGGVGIMNIMYVSVTERTFEIGLRKSLGAKYKNILWQFLVEALILTILGSLIGIIFGLTLTFLVSIGAGALGYEWPFIISWPGIFLALFMSTLIGLTFGLYPARQAAKMDAIDSLRYE